VVVPGSADLRYAGLLLARRACLRAKHRQAQASRHTDSRCSFLYRRGTEDAENKPAIRLPLSVGRYGQRITDNGHGSCDLLRVAEGSAGNSHTGCQLEFLPPTATRELMVSLFSSCARCQATGYGVIASSRSSARHAWALAIVSIGNVGSSGPATTAPPPPHRSTEAPATPPSYQLQRGSQIRW